MLADFSACQKVLFMGPVGVAWYLEKNQYSDLSSFKFEKENEKCYHAKYKMQSRKRFSFIENIVYQQWIWKKWLNFLGDKSENTGFRVFFVRKLLSVYMK